MLNMADDIKKKTRTRLLGIDLEATGLDTEKDQIIELSFALKDLGNPKILKRASFLIEPIEHIPIEISAITGIRMPMIKEFGTPLVEAIHWVEDALLHGVDFICAHNGDAFDKPLLLSEIRRSGIIGLGQRIFDTPWIDTTRDLPYPDTLETRKLKYLAFEHGILGHYAHDSLSDVETMLRLLDCYREEEILEHIHDPNLILKIHTDYQNRDEAKKLRYHWEVLGHEKFEKSWVKRIKAKDLEKECAKTQFTITVLREEKRQ